MPKILFADPDKNLTEFLKPFLKSKGFDSISTTSGNEFLQVVADVNPDVVIIDLDLKNPSAIETLKEIKGNERLKTIPVILTSKGDQRELVRKAINEGADDYLMKPFFLDLLCA
ncbi:MAG: response regulator, partial [Candidatus Aenigmatarchaeota archaeon]